VSYKIHKKSAKKLVKSLGVGDMFSKGKTHAPIRTYPGDNLRKE